MIVLYAPADGRLLSSCELLFQKRRFPVPFEGFFENDAPVLHLSFRLTGRLIHAPAAGIVTHVDTVRPCFLIEGLRRAALWLHAEDGTPSALADGKLLPLVDTGSPIRQNGQLLGHLDAAALRTPLHLSLLTARPIGGRLRCREGEPIVGQSPLLTADRAFS